MARKDDFDNLYDRLQEALAITGSLKLPMVENLLRMALLEMADCRLQADHPVCHEHCSTLAH